MGDFMTTTINASNNIGLVINSDNSQTIQFQANGANSMFMASNGFIGVGTTSPTSQFHSMGSITANVGIITDQYISSDGNSIYKHYPSLHRQVFSVYGFDFTLDNGLLLCVNKTRQLLTGASGSNGTLVVPAGVTKMFIKMWGAGGGGGTYGGWRQGALGGAGGFSMGIIQVVPGETLTYRVGVNGSCNAGSTTSFPDGGAPSTAAGDNRYCASGGGSTSIYVPSQSAWTMVAGGGGGGGACNGYALNSGGAGGGLVGEQGHITGYSGGVDNGKAGTQTAGGAAGTGSNTTGQAGSQFAGGTHQNSNCYGGGGGGGWYGGGSGAYDAGNSMGGGGGGSGYIHSSVIMGQTFTGQSFIPPFYWDPDLQVNTSYRYARGGDEGGVGGCGLLVGYW